METPLGEFFTLLPTCEDRWTTVDLISIRQLGSAGGYESGLLETANLTVRIFRLGDLI
jgi:hypothetical protein